MRLTQFESIRRAIREYCGRLLASVPIRPLSAMALVTAGLIAATPIGSATSTANATNTPTPGYEPASAALSEIIADPTVPISVDKTLAIPGDTVTFALSVNNNGNASAPNVVITDNLPKQLQVTSVSSTQGTFTVDGGTVIFVVGNVSPGKIITLKVITKISNSVTPPVDVSNSVVLTWLGGITARNSNTVWVRITRGQLPNTGEHPNEPSKSLSWLIIIGVLFGGLALIARHGRHPNCPLRETDV